MPEQHPFTLADLEKARDQILAMPQPERGPEPHREHPGIRFLIGQGVTYPFDHAED